ncbi:MAG: hypothetical protein Q4F21_01025 [Lachnospiraceae bacterium]|nr:hypothetical protein [Lachnospiraceae bacterium]
MRVLTAAFLMTAFLIGALHCVCTMESRQLHQEELEMAVEMAMRHSLSEAGIRKSYAIKNNRELYADFLGELMLISGAEAEYTVKGYEVDVKKGVMDVEVVSDYILPGGEKGQAVCRKYAVLTQV